jgi:hypothetical protein
MCILDAEADRTLLDCSNADADDESRIFANLATIYHYDSRPHQPKQLCSLTITGNDLPSLDSNTSFSSDIMATRYAESNVSLAFDANLASGLTTPGITTPGYEQANDPLAPMVQPMSFGEDGLEGRVLPRADGGKDAWLVLVGCFTLEALVWGSVITSDLITGRRD